MNTDINRAGVFFESMLPRLIALRADLFDRTQGSLSVLVQGEGEWTVTFGDHRRPDAVTATASLDADCVAVFSAAAFSELLDGAVREPAAVIGDVKLIGRLGQLLLEPARGALGVRLASTALAVAR